MKLTTHEVEKFNEDGFLVVENYLSQEKIDELKKEIYKCIEEYDFTDFNHVSFMSQYFISIIFFYFNNEFWILNILSIP